MKPMHSDTRSPMRLKLIERPRWWAACACENVAARLSGCKLRRHLGELSLVLYPNWSLEVASLLLNRVGLLIFWVGSSQRDQAGLIQSVRAADMCRRTYGFGYGIAVWGSICGPSVATLWESGVDAIVDRAVRRRPLRPRVTHLRSDQDIRSTTRSAR